MADENMIPLHDPRGYLFSCFDGGGTDWTDDWIFVPNGFCGKYDSMGFIVYKSPFMRNMDPLFQVLFSIRWGEKYFHQWRNMYVDLALADLMKISGPFWPWGETSMRGRIILPDVNTVLWELDLTSRNLDPMELELTACAIPYPSADGAYVLSGVQNGLTLGHGRGTLALVGKDFEARDNNRLSRTVTLNPGQGVEIRLAFSAQDPGDHPVSALRALEALDLDADLVEEKILSYYRRIPVSGVKNKSWRQLIYKIYNDKRANCFKLGDGTLFEVPDRPLHKGQWLWDSVFHAMAWRHYDPAVSTEILMNLLRVQDPETGWIPINTIDPARVEGYASQPPIIAWAVDEIVNDQAAIEDAYPRLAAFHGWWERERKLLNGLFSWRTGGESGMDNSPRFDPDVYRIDPDADKDHCGRDFFSAGLCCIDLSCMMALSARCLSSLAKKAGRSMEESMAWESYYLSLRKKINDFLWDKETGFYFDRHVDGTWRRIKTVACFWALISGVADNEKAMDLERHILNPGEFWTEYPLPSVSIDTPQFDLNYWRGLTWPNINYVVCKGLELMGFMDSARELSRRSVNMVLSEYHRTGFIWEAYNPFGDGVERCEKKFQGPRQVAEYLCGWTATTANLILEILHQ